MISKQLVSQLENYWNQAQNPEVPVAVRLEHMLTAFQVMMTSVINDNDAVQRFWESTNLLPAILSAENDQAIGEGGTIRKDAWVKYQVLHLSFRTWLSTPVSANLPTGQLDENDEMISVPVTLTETPAQLLMQPPARVSNE